MGDAREMESERLAQRGANEADAGPAYAMGQQQSQTAWAAYTRGLGQGGGKASGGAGKAGANKASGAKVGAKQAAGAKQAGANGKKKTDKGPSPSAQLQQLDAGQGAPIAAPADPAPPAAGGQKAATAGGKAGGGTSKGAPTKMAAGKGGTTQQKPPVVKQQRTQAKPVQTSTSGAPAVVQGALANLLANAEAQQATMAAEGERQKQLTRQAGEIQKQRLAQASGNLRSQVVSDFAVLRQGYTTRGEAAKENIAGHRSAELQRLRDTASAQIERLRSGPQTKAEELIAHGDALSGQAVSHGDTEAARARSAGEQKAAAAVAIGEAKATKYAKYDEAEEIGKTARTMASKVAEAIGKTGADVATIVSDDADSLATKLQDEAVAQAQDFTVDEAAISGIEAAVADAEAALAEGSNALVAQVDDAVAEASAAADEAERAALEQLDQSALDLAPSVDAVVASACGAVDEAVAGAQTAIATAVDEVSVATRRVGPAGAAGAVATIETLGSELAAGSSAVQQGIIDVGEAAVSALETTGADIAEALDTSAETITGNNQRAAEAFDTQLGEVEKQANADTTEKVDQVLGDIEGRVAAIETKLAESYAERAGALEELLAKGKTEITAKVDGVVREMDAALARLGPQITDKADALENSGFWAKLGSAVWSFLKGFVSSMWAFVSGLAVMLLVIVAVLVIAIALIALWTVLFGPTLLVTLFLVAAAWGGTVLAVLGYIGVAAAMIVLAMSIHLLYQIWMNPDASWEEKWTQSGKTAWDVVETLDPFKLLKAFAGLFKGAKAIDTAADLSKADVLSDLTRAGRARKSPKASSVAAEALASLKGKGKGASKTPKSAPIEVPTSAGRVPPRRAVDPKLWNKADLSQDDAFRLYQTTAKKPVGRAQFNQKFDDGFRFNPTTHRWRKPSGVADAARATEVAVIGKSGKAWNDPKLTAGDFITDYRHRYPNTKLTDAQLAGRFDDMKRLDPSTGRLSDPKWKNTEIREWYLQENARIEGLNTQWLKQGLSAEERARRAQAIRHSARVRARAAMSNATEVKDLRARDMKKYGNPDGPTFEDLVKKQGDEHGLYGEDAFEAIIGSSQRTDAATNARLGMNTDAAGRGAAGRGAAGGGATHAPDDGIRAHVGKAYDYHFVNRAEEGADSMVDVGSAMTKIKRAGKAGKMHKVVTAAMASKTVNDASATSQDAVRQAATQTDDAQNTVDKKEEEQTDD